VSFVCNTVYSYSHALSITHTHTHIHTDSLVQSLRPVIERFAHNDLGERKSTQSQVLTHALALIQTHTIDAEDVDMQVCGVCVCSVQCSVYGVCV
jgi:hypothetical protein